MANSIYLKSKNPYIFVTAVRDYPQIHQVYENNSLFIENQKPKEGARFLGYFLNTGDPQTNYAFHKTLSGLLGEAFTLYPNGYSLVWQNQNDFEANNIFFRNYITEYSDIADLVSKLYSKEYKNDFSTNLNSFKESGTLYEDLYFASIDLDTAIAVGYYWNLEYLPIRYSQSEDLREEKVKLFRYIDSHLNNIFNTIHYSPKFDFTETQLVVTTQKVQLYRENIFSGEEQEKLLANSILSLKYLIENKSSSLQVLLKELPKNSFQYNAIKLLGEKDVFIDSYFKEINF
jgi:hypothetical protein